jgi:hypothetical protein
MSMKAKMRVLLEAGVDQTIPEISNGKSTVEIPKTKVQCICDGVTPARPPYITLLQISLIGTGTNAKTIQCCHKIRQTEEIKYR